MTLWLESRLEPAIGPELTPRAVSAPELLLLRPGETKLEGTEALGLALERVETAMSRGDDRFSPRGDLGLSALEGNEGIVTLRSSNSFAGIISWDEKQLQDKNIRKNAIRTKQESKEKQKPHVRHK